MVKSIMRAIPFSTRERIIRLYEQDKSTREIAEFLGFCVAAVRRVRQQFRQRGTLQPQTHLCGRKTLLTAAGKARLQKLVEGQPDATLAGLGARLAGEPPRRLVFVDESGANTKRTRFRGRAPIGQRQVARVPLGHYQTTTLVCAIRLTGPSAPWLFEGAMDGEMFLAWIQQGLVPVLQKGDVVIMDNLPTHKVAGVLQAIEEAGARLIYLPPYSPDFNPIENMWSKIKQILRSWAPRTGEELLPAAKAAFEAISAADCQGFFLNARYAI
jgi:transposase/transposase-like protein